MIQCVCIDDSKKPKEIPDHKWIKKDEYYHVIYSVIVLPQGELAFLLSEIQLTDNELPYEYFLAKRFAFKQKDLSVLVKLIKDCNDIEFSEEDLFGKTTIVKKEEEIAA